MKKLLLILFCLPLLFNSCTKGDDVPEGHNGEENNHKHDSTCIYTVIPDSSIAFIDLEYKINTLYIHAIGRLAGTEELEKTVDYLRSNQLCQISREVIITEVLNKSDYIDNLFQVECVSLLEGADNDYIDKAKSIIDSIVLTVSGLDSLHYVNESNRLKDLQQVLPGLRDGSINRFQMHKRMVDNIIYDNINMNTFNFVNATFDNFMRRYPTQYEFDEVYKMIEGQNGTLFSVDGNSKDAFLDIFLQSDEYYIGQVGLLCLRLNSFETPFTLSNIELNIEYSAMEYKTTQDYKALHASILLYVW